MAALFDGSLKRNDFGLFKVKEGAISIEKQPLIFVHFHSGYYSTVLLPYAKEEGNYLGFEEIWTQIGGNVDKRIKSEGI